MGVMWSFSALRRQLRSRLFPLPPTTDGSYLRILSPTNPVHVRSGPDDRLRPLAFLVGHFYGHGYYTGRPGSFQKEVTGGWEAGGRFLSLRLGVNYPLSDGRNDCHQALVIIGLNAAARALEGRAYTDAGSVVTYPIEFDGPTVRFPDRPPGHGAGRVRARKVLRPTADGYEERLETERPDGRFEAYSILQLRRVTNGNTQRW